ncbi:hypothetical protein CMU49_02415 [Elizabethkingia anophelis]|nr:hypothetical protein [Elizabethkingia anophelis]MDV3692365.1 hypothetical protein [Elizabethkingia anophelis]
MNKYYNLSRDYSKLYDLIRNKTLIVCFIDYYGRYREENDYPPCRDVAKINYRSDNDIDIGVRGISYGGIGDFGKQNRSSKERFIEECESLNLEWIENRE